MTDTRVWFIADQPLASDENDVFDHADVANNLASIIDAVPTPLTIGLIGEFGVGKSTAIEMLRRSSAGNIDYRVIRVSAQRHSNVNAERSLLYSIIDELLRAGMLTEKQFSEKLKALESTGARASTDALEVPLKSIIANNSQARRRAIKWASVAAALWLTFVTCIGLLLSYLDGTISTLWEILVSGVGVPIAALVGTVGAAATWLTNARLTSAVAMNFLKPDTVTTTRPRLEAADEMERHFAEIVKVVDRRLVIAVDDIDRLPTDRMVDALNVVHDFQAACAGTTAVPIFIVSCDDNVVRDALVVGSPQNARYDFPGQAQPVGDPEKIAQAYLDRYFNQRLRMPPHSATDLRDFAVTVLNQSNHVAQTILGAELAGTIEVLIHDSVDNPRHAIKLLNAFFGDLRMAQRREGSPSRRGIRNGEVTSKPRVLARLTVIRIDFELAYREISATPDLLAALISYVRDEQDDAQKQAVEDLVLLLDGGNNVSEHEHAQSRLADRQSTKFLRYISRTASWVEDVASLRPFIELGQDAIDRQLGSDAATKYRRQVVNAEVRTLGPAVEEIVANAAGERRQDFHSLLDLFSTLLRNASGVELNNTLESIDYIAPQLDPDARTRLADEVGLALLRASSDNHLSSNSVPFIEYSQDERARLGLARTLTAVRPDDRSSTTTRALEFYDRWDSITSALQSDQAIFDMVGETLELIGRAGSAAELEPWVERLQQPSNRDDFDTARRVLRAALTMIFSSELEDSLPSNDEVAGLLDVADRSALPDLSVSQPLEQVIRQYDLDGAVGRLIAGLARRSHSPTTSGTLTSSLLEGVLVPEPDGWPGNILAETVRDVCLTITEALNTGESVDFVAVDDLIARILSLSVLGGSIVGHNANIDDDEASEIATSALNAMLKEKPAALVLATSWSVRGWRESRERFSDAYWWIEPLVEDIDRLEDDPAIEVISSLREVLEGQPRSIASPQALDMLKLMASTERGRPALEATLNSATSNVNPSTPLPVIEGAIDCLISLTAVPDYEAPTQTRAALSNIVGIDSDHRAQAMRGLLEVTWASADRVRLLHEIAPHISAVSRSQVVELMDLVRSAHAEGQQVEDFTDNVQAAIASALADDDIPSSGTLEFAWQRLDLSYRSFLAARRNNAAALVRSRLIELGSEEQHTEIRAIVDSVRDEVVDSELPAGASAVAVVLQEFFETRKVAEAVVSDFEEGLASDTITDYWTFLADSLTRDSCEEVVQRLVRDLDSGHEKFTKAVTVLHGFCTSNFSEQVSASLIDAELPRRLADLTTPSQELEHEDQEVEVVDLAELLAVSSRLKNTALQQLGRKPGRNDVRRPLWERASETLKRT